MPARAAPGTEGRFRAERELFGEKRGRNGSGRAGPCLAEGRMKKEQVAHCRFSVWYPLFRTVTIRRCVGSGEHLWGGV